MSNSVVCINCLFWGSKSPLPPLVNYRAKCGSYIKWCDHTPWTKKQICVSCSRHWLHNIIIDYVYITYRMVLLHHLNLPQHMTHICRVESVRKHHLNASVCSCKYRTKICHSKNHIQRYSEPSRRSNRSGNICAHATSDWRTRMPRRNGVSGTVKPCRHW